MKAKKAMASTAKKCAKRVSIAAAAAFCMGANYAGDAAAQEALKDILSSEGEYLDGTTIAYTWNPFDGLVA